MNYHNITKDDMLNGEGLRTVLWVAGCEHRCEKCHNPITWDCNCGLPFTQVVEDEFFDNLTQPHIQGATFSGGDPLHPANRNTIGKLAAKVKNEKKDVWVYTGYQFMHNESGFYFENEVTKQTFAVEWLDKIDILIDGRFDCKIREKDMEEEKEVLWKGSSNQRTIDVQASLKEKRIVTIN